jgi:hypothetical protein
MSKYGYCKDCGCVMEAVGCSNCDELAVIQMIDSFPDQSNSYPDWSQD